MTTTRRGPHRCYAALARRHLLASAIGALPIPVAAHAAAVTVFDGHTRPATPLLHIDPLQMAAAVVLVTAGVTGWALLEHLAAHWFATAAASTPAGEQRPASPDQPDRR
jgi:hypothetical protein